MTTEKWKGKGEEMKKGGMFRESKVKTEYI